MRRGKVIAQAEQFVNIVGASIENVLAELRELKKYVREAEAEAQGVEEDEIIMQELRGMLCFLFVTNTRRRNFLIVLNILSFINTRSRVLTRIHPSHYQEQ